MSMTPVVIETPLSGDFIRNRRYAYLACKDCLRRGEAPYASHLFYTQFLDDTIPDSRTTGMQAGFAWASLAKVRVVYSDLGISSGMKAGLEEATKLGQTVLYRSIPSFSTSMLDDQEFWEKTPGF